MSIRPSYSYFLLLLVVVADVAGAQRLPIFGRRGRGAAPAEMPRQPAAIARELAYRRSKLSIESYPLVTHVLAPGIVANGASEWTAFGAGTRASYRVNSWTAATFDMTSTPFSGVATTETAELGARLGPQAWDHKIHPFVDARVGYVRAFDGYFNSYGTANFVPSQSANRVRYSQGAGGVAGVGMDRAVSRRFSVTLGWSVMRGRLDARSGDITPGASQDTHFWMTSYRYTLGLRFNPVRLLNSTQQRDSR